MKLHLPVKLWKGLMMAMAVFASTSVPCSAAETVVINDASPEVDDWGGYGSYTYWFENVNLKLSGSKKLGNNDYTGEIIWHASESDVYTLGGSGTLSSGTLTIEIEGRGVFFVVEKTLTFSGMAIYTPYEPYEEYTIDFNAVAKNCYFMIESGGNFDASDAKISGNTYMMLQGGTLVTEKYTHTSGTYMEMHGDSIVDGNLTLSGKSFTFKGTKYYDYDTDFIRGTIHVSWGYDLDEDEICSCLTVTGNMTVTSKTAIIFYTGYYHDTDEQATQPPQTSPVVFKCGSVNEKQLSLLIPYLEVEVDTTCDYCEQHSEDDDWNWKKCSCQWGSELTLLSDREFLARAGEDGLIHVYLGWKRDENGVPGNAIKVSENTTVSLTGTKIPSIERPVYMMGGTADASSLDDDLLNNQTIIGSAGYLRTTSSQTMSLIGSDEIKYSIVGARSGSAGADILIGSSEHNNGNIKLSGEKYDSELVMVQGGLLTVGEKTTLGLGASATTVQAENSASISNYGTLAGKVSLQDYSTMLNQGEIKGSVVIKSDATYINNGVQNGKMEVNGAAYGSGTFSETVVLSGGTLHVDNTTGKQSHSALTLKRGSVTDFYTPDASLSVAEDTHSLLTVKSLTLESGCIFDVSDLTGRGTYDLLQYSTLTGSVGNISLRKPDGSMNTFSLTHDAANKTLTLNVEGMAVWAWNEKSKSGVWQNGTYDKTPLLGNAKDGFCAGDSLTIQSAATVTLQGELAPSLLHINSAKNVTLKSVKKTPGSLVGDGSVLVTGNGKVSMNDGNSYSGGTIIENGTVTASGATSFGTGEITVSGGTLNLNSKAIANDIVVQGSVLIQNGKKFAGNVTLLGYGLKKGSVINIAAGKTAEYISVENDEYEDDDYYDDNLFTGSAAINGTISGEGTFLIDAKWEEEDEWYDSYNYAYLGTNGKITCDLTLRGNLHVGRNGLAMNSKTSDIIIDSGDLYSEGKISACTITLMNGGHLSAAKDKPLNVTTTGKFSAVSTHPTESDDWEDYEDWYGVHDWITESADASKAHIYGKLSVGSLELVNSGVYVEQTWDYAYDPKVQSVAVKNEASLDGSQLRVGGSFSAASLSLTNASHMELFDPTLRHNKTMSLKVKNDMLLTGGSSLLINGSLSAKNLTLGSGSISLTSSKLQTIKVSNMLSFEEDSSFTLNLGFSVTEKDFYKNKAFKIVSFKTLGGSLTPDSDLNKMFGISENLATLSFDTKVKSITLVVNDLDLWNEYIEDVRDMEYSYDDWDDYSIAAVAAAAEEPPVSEDSVAEEVVEAEEVLLTPVADAADVDALLGKVADTLVQSTWGTVGASRAFSETIAGRGRNATLLGEDGKGAAWLSVMGGSSRISSAEGHNGADFTLSGAAFGVEGRVGEKSTLGVAIGNSWGKVSTFSAFPVDQDSMHVGIYGNHTLTKSLTLGWMATHTRTESDATILGAPYSWSQDALQLDARLTWGKSISDKTAVSAFAGLQYLATDSGECAGLKTGSLQNLRAELGVGASHKCSDSTLVFGELSFIGDMVRNNPTAAIGDYRTHGTNPGRVGLNLSVGAQHQLSEDWSVNASYSMELMENSTSHSLNVGASYSF